MSRKKFYSFLWHSTVAVVMLFVHLLCFRSSYQNKILFMAEISPTPPIFVQASCCTVWTPPHACKSRLSTRWDETRPYSVFGSLLGRLVKPDAGPHPHHAGGLLVRRSAGCSSGGRATEDECWFLSSSSSMTQKPKSKGELGRGSDTCCELSWRHVSASKAIPLKTVVSGVYNEYSRWPTGTRKPQAIRRRARDG